MHIIIQLVHDAVPKLQQMRKKCRGLTSELYLIKELFL
jgi:hypothetical protein